MSGVFCLVLIAKNTSLPQRVQRFDSWLAFLGEKKQIYIRFLQFYKFIRNRIIANLFENDWWMQSICFIHHIVSETLHLVGDLNQSVLWGRSSTN